MPPFGLKFSRSLIVADGHQYKKYREYTRQDFNNFCAYCFRHEDEIGGAANYCQDHFRPQQKFPQEERVFSNLYWCCNECNNSTNKGSNWPSEIEYRQGKKFCDPCEANPVGIHYDISANGLLSPTSESGNYTVLKLNLNIRTTLRKWRHEREKQHANWGLIRNRFADDVAIHRLNCKDCQIAPCDKLTLAIEILHSMDQYLCRVPFVFLPSPDLSPSRLDKAFALVEKL